MTQPADRYPVLLEVEPPAPQGRWSVFLRLLLAIPHWFLLFFIGVATFVLGFLVWLVILFTGRAPAGMLDFLTGAQRWSTRVSGYTYLLSGQFPPFSLGEEPQYPVRLVIDQLVEPRNRLTVAFRLILAFPQMLIVSALQQLAQIIAFLGWFAALFTGAMPLAFHDLIVATLRWQVRVQAYTGLLIDKYPPFEWNQARSA
jgi:hypothetical protein